jgi:hypothetical protein
MSNWTFEDSKWKMKCEQALIIKTTIFNQAVREEMLKETNYCERVVE